MKINDWLIQATQALTNAGIATARLDALVLLEDALGIDRAKILANPEMEVTDEALEKLDDKVARRAQHEPLAYIRGRTEFYGREFKISPHVLEPRPESETMIDLLKALVLDHADMYSPAGKTVLSPNRSARARITQSGSKHRHAQLSKLPGDVKKLRIADVGAGSGALGITAALELPGVFVDLLELDPLALANAKMNVDFFTLSISSIKSDLLLQSAQNYHILLCNLPYVPDSHTINAAALHEPRIAIFGGEDGLDLYRKLFKQLKMVDEKPLYILTEALPPQHKALAEIAKEHSYGQVKTDDFIQLFALI